jgi:hypothetical protein
MGIISGTSATASTEAEPVRIRLDSPSGKRMRSTSTFFAAILLVFSFLIAGPASIRAQEPNVALGAAVQLAAPSLAAPLPEAPAQASTNSTISAAQTGNIIGTVTDTNGDLVPGAVAVLEDSEPADRQTQVANDNGFFQFAALKPGIPYRVTISANGFQNWVFPATMLTAGQFLNITDIRLKLEGGVTAVTVSASSDQIAVEQVSIEEKQRVLGIVPNFYVLYDSKDAVALPAKLKYKLAIRVSVDPIRIAAAGFLGAVDQAANSNSFGQGWRAYGWRTGTSYADGFTDLMFGGAVLPSLLHQDPRYYYQGTGTVKSRMMHAMSYPFICYSDNGRLQPNYSTIGGDAISAAISDTYYPRKDRGGNLVLQLVLVNTAEREASSLVQEFLLRRFTSHSKRSN